MRHAACEPGVREWTHHNCGRWDAEMRMRCWAATGTASRTRSPTPATPSSPANILRTDMHAHSPLAQDSDLARAQQDTTWNRQQISNQLRCLLREYVRREVACL